MNDLLWIKEYWTRELTQEKDIDILQELCENCIDYYEMNGGRTEDLSNCGQDLFDDLPPGKDHNDKSIVGLFVNENTLAGIIEIVKDYPEEKTWYIGQMMMRREMRGQGIGQGFLQEYLKYLSELNVNKIRLGVLQENEKAYRFWKRMGFKLIYERENYEIGDKTTTAYVMEREL